jgi:hypothetical protein
MFFDSAGRRPRAVTAVRLPLWDACRAHERLAGSAATGKLVLVERLPDGAEARLGE